MPFSITILYINQHSRHWNIQHLIHTFLHPAVSCLMFILNLFIYLLACLYQSYQSFNFRLPLLVQRRLQEDWNLFRPMRWQGGAALWTSFWLITVRHRQTVKLEHTWTQPILKYKISKKLHLHVFGQREKAEVSGENHAVLEFICLRISCIHAELICSTIVN